MTIEEFLKDDRYAVFSGVKLIEARPGYAKTQMEVKPMHLNAGNVVQGGALFTLADLAFAAAANAYGVLSVSAETSIRFFKGVRQGVLTAVAKTVHLHIKLATFQVEIRDESGELVALFTATAYRKNVPLNINNPEDFESLA